MLASFLELLSRVVCSHETFLFVQKVNSAFKSSGWLACLMTVAGRVVSKFMQCNRSSLLWTVCIDAAQWFHGLAGSFFLPLFLTLMSILFRLFHFPFGAFARLVNCSRRIFMQKRLFLRAHKLSEESFYRFIHSTINQKTDKKTIHAKQKGKLLKTFCAVRERKRERTI